MGKPLNRVYLAFPTAKPDKLRSKFSNESRFNSCLNEFGNHQAVKGHSEGQNAKLVLLGDRMSMSRLPSTLGCCVLGSLLGWGLLLASEALGLSATTNELPFQGQKSWMMTQTSVDQSSSQEPRSPVDAAAYLFSQGLKQFQSRQYEAALASWQQAATLYQQFGDRQQQGRILGNIGAIYQGLGDYTQAQTYFEQSLNIAETIGDTTGESLALNNLGYLYSNRGNYSAAIAIRQRARSLAQARGNRQDESDSLNGLGIVYKAQGNYDEAIRHFKLALEIAREIGAGTGEAEVLGNLGNVAAERGEYREALAYYEQCLQVMERLGDRRSQGIVRQRLGNVYLDLGNLDAAYRYYQESLTLVREVRDVRLEAYSLGNLGIVARQRDDFKLAFNYLGQALAKLNQVGDLPREAVLRTVLGNTYLEQQDYDQARQNYEQSLVIAQAIGDRQAESMALGNLGLVDDLTGQVERAMERYTQSLDMAQKLGDRLRQGQALNNLGALYYYRSKNLQKAADTLIRAVEIWESMRPGLSDENQISLFETQSHTYRLLQKVLIDLNRPNDALEISERGRARAFVELVATRLSASTATRFQTKPLTIDQIRQVARQQQATLVQYSVLNDSQLAIWVIQPNGTINLRLSQLDASEVSIQQAAESSRVAAALGRSFRKQPRGIEQQVRRMQEAVRGAKEIGEREPTKPPTAIAPPAVTPGKRRLNPQLQVLHQFLIQPIADLLPTDPNQQVVIIPHEALFLVPFAALQDGKGTFLIEQHTLRSAPAIQVLSFKQAGPKPSSSMNQHRLNNGSTLVVGNPVMPKLGNPPTQMAKLPYAEQEAREIATLLNTKPLIGAIATEPYITRRMSTAKVIHLATHALLDDLAELGMPGAIALTPTRTTDGLLTSGEILNLSLQAELVVLSACDTGRGKITGDGVVGLARSFLSAGAKSVVVSLWAVPDAPTAVLMTEFYQALQQGKSHAQALRQAMIMMLERYPNSRDWAAFMLIGITDEPWN